MSQKYIKWLIICIPTFAIGVWEYVRHSFHIPHLTMELGNWFSPGIVMIVTMIFLLPLFRILEEIQEQLKEERAKKAVLEERERIAEQLHDGVAQSLFFMSVQMDQLKPGLPNTEQAVDNLRKTVFQANDYVRQAIHNLRLASEEQPMTWLESLQALIRCFETEAGVRVEIKWDIPQEALASKDKVELYAIIREALMNVRKHANASTVWVSGRMAGSSGWIAAVEDDGIGFSEDALSADGRYGLRIVREKALEMGWTFHFDRTEGRTRLEIRKEGVD